jgi:non-reducing end alpha-L-arabinofuranosidase
MKTGNCWNRISLVVLLGIGCWGCTVTSGNPMDAAVATCTPSTICDGFMPDPPPPPGATQGPCDIYGAEPGGRCVAAHSTVRALYGGYNGPLYQVKKMVDGTTKDIGVLEAGGLANGADQDAFCGVEACTISKIYDQSGYRNHLTRAPPSMIRPMETNEANAKALPVMFGTNKAYGIHIVPGGGYRYNDACGTATCDNPETEYMVVGGDFFNGGCCFDYGNMERNSRNNHEGTMEAVYFGTCTIWGKGDGAGPWVMGDLEDGLWAGASSPWADNKPITHKFIVGMVKGGAAGANRWAIKSGNAQSGPLNGVFDGQRPTNRYNPMRKEGAIGLGTGGDGSSGAQGNWFEGVMTSHFSSDAADDAVQANIVSVYSRLP